MLSSAAAIVFAAALTIHPTAAGVWSAAPSLPVAVQEVSVTSLNGHVYVVGGSTNQSRVNTVYVLDPAAASPAWTTKAPYPGTARDHIGIAALGHFIYLIGGVAAWPSPSVNTVQRYDSTTDTWTTVAPLPVARGAMAVAALNGSIYAAGGLVNGAAVSDFTVYDPTTDAWQTLPPMPTPRDHATGVALDGRFYVTGGRTTSTCSPLTTVEVFDPATSSWSTVAPMRFARGGHGAAAVNGRLYVFGGEGAPSTCGTIGSAEEYDPATNTWTDLPSMPTARHGTNGAVVGSTIYVPGGGTATGDAPTSVVEKLDTAATSSVPAPWDSRDIGNVGLAGTASHANGVFTVTGAGLDIWGSADAFRFVSQPMSGDGQIVARVSAIQNTHPYAKAGVMLRAALTANAPHVLLNVRPGGGLEFMTRSATGGATTLLGSATPGVPVWLRLVRSGSTVIASWSATGTTWSEVGRTTTTLPATVYAGLPVTSHTTSALNTSTFDNVSVTAGTTPLPSPWASGDIGNVGLAGSASHASSVFTVKGAGADIWGNADAFHFVSQPMTGDGQIVARVTAIQNTHPYAKAGVMLRAALTANAPHVLLNVKPNGDLEFMTRSATGGATTFLGSATPGVPVWLRLTRSGSTVIAAWSPTGMTWTEVGRTTTSLPATVYAGLPVTSHTTAALNTATFDHVSVSAGAVNQPPSVTLTAPTAGATFPAPASVSVAATASDPDGTVSSVQFFANGTSLGTDTTSPYGLTWTVSTPGTYTLTAVATDSGGAQTQSAGVTVSITGSTSLPSPWASSDIGNVGLAGSASHANGVFTVKGAGADIWGSADSFHYVYQPFTGDGQITVRVTSLQNTHTFAKAGVMFRQSPTAGSPHVMLDVRPNGNAEFISRSSANGSSILHAGQSVPFPGWLKLIRSGNSFAGYTSVDGTLWTHLGSVNVSMSSTVYVGMPVLSHNTTVLTTATFDSVVVSNDATPPTSTISFSLKRLAVGGTTSGTAYGIPGFDGPTSLQLGPDGRLYVATVLGQLYILTLNPAALSDPSQIAVTNVQQLNDIYLKPSRTCNIDGDPWRCEYLSTIGAGRLVLGLLVDPASTSDRIVLYVSNSGMGQGTTDMSLDTYSGTISRLTLVPDTTTANPNDFQVVEHTDLVVGLPRSREVHAVNGMSIGPDGWLYLSVGGHTNAGKPSDFFANLPEYYLSASVVRLNRSQLGAASLPIDVSHVRTAADMAPLTGLLELYATGYRNGYDLTWHSNGKLYLNDNASNLGQGNTPGATEGCTTPSIVPGNRPDDLNLVIRGGYGGHPNPTHGECVFDDGALYSPPLAPHSHFVPPLLGYADGASTNGIAEYRSDAFGGLMRGNLISATYAGNQNVRRVVLDATGTAVLQEHNLATFVEPLDVETDLAGNIYVAEYGADRLTVMLPASVGTCPQPGSDPAVTDSDGDGYTDADETANNTDVCSPASRPPDFDGDLVSDLLDPDDDNDGITDVNDQLFFDAQNGAGTSVPLAFEYNPTEPARGFVANTGFRGVQIASSGVRLSASDIKAGDAGGHLTLTTHAGTAVGTANNQVNALQIGFNSTSAFRIRTRIVQPFSSTLPAPGHAGGIFFGPNQNNFFRLALVGTASGGMAVQAGLEANGVFAVRGTVAVAVVPVSHVDLVILGDPATSTLAAYMDVNGTGSFVAVATGVSVPAAWFSTNVGTAANSSLAGIMTSHGGAAPTAFGFDFFRIERP